MNRCTLTIAVGFLVLCCTSAQKSPLKVCGAKNFPLRDGCANLDSPGSVFDEKVDLHFLKRQVFSAQIVRNILSSCPPFEFCIDESGLLEGTAMEKALAVWRDESLRNQICELMPCVQVLIRNAPKCLSHTQEMILRGFGLLCNLTAESDYLLNGVGCLDTAVRLLQFAMADAEQLQKIDSKAHNLVSCGPSICSHPNDCPWNCKVLAQKYNCLKTRCPANKGGNVDSLFSWMTNNPGLLQRSTNLTNCLIEVAASTNLQRSADRPAFIINLVRIKGIRVAFCAVILCVSIIGIVMMSIFFCGKHALCSVRKRTQYMEMKGAA